MLAVGTILDGRYEILEPLAEGGMGAVFRARRRLLGDEVALKIVRSEIGGDQAAPHASRAAGCGGRRTGRSQQRYFRSIRSARRRGRGWAATLAPIEVRPALARWPCPAWSGWREERRRWITFIPSIRAAFLSAR